MKPTQAATATLHFSKRTSQPASEEKGGAPDKIRTCDLLLRRQALYPSELRARGET